jgi:hypothetical protein
MITNNAHQSIKNSSIISRDLCDDDDDEIYVFFKNITNDVIMMQSVVLSLTSLVSQI